MSRYNSNYGSHDQLQDLRKLNMEVMRERDALQREVMELKVHLQIAEDYGLSCDDIIEQYIPNWKPKP